jgi:tetratricopeptide (TPR) repeat protein
MGGQGKTQLTLEYCRQMKDVQKFRAIFWLDASSREALYRAMEAIAKQLQPERVLNSPQAALALVKHVLSNWSDAWLLVFDNLDDPSDLDHILNFFPDSRYGCILVTSRHAGCKELGQSIEVDRMEKDEGLQLLLRFTDTSAAQELVDAEQILALLEYLPLAIAQTQAYISRRQLPLRDFVDEYEKRKQHLLRETPPFWQYSRRLPDTQEKTPLSLFTTWEMSLPLLRTGEGHAGALEEVLMVFAFFHRLSISEKLFSVEDTGAPFAGSPMSIFIDNGHWDHFKFECVVVQMQELSLLRFSRRNADEIVVSLLSMVSEWLRTRLNKYSQFTFLSAAVSHLERYLRLTDHKDYITRQEALSHMDNICRFEEFQTRDDFSDACRTFGIFYADQGRLEAAERMYNRTLDIREKTMGSEHTSTLAIINDLGILYRLRGRLDDAERMYNRALDVREKTMGPEHPSTLAIINNLGILYRRRGRLEDAERMYNCALAGYEKAFGLEHTSTLGTVNSLGILYDIQGRLEDAERMYNRALAGFEKALGPEHAYTLETINNLGILYRRRGRLEDAEGMYNRALNLKEKALGPGHTSTLSTLNNLGNLYLDQGRLEDAERTFNCALYGKEKELGPEHTSTLDTVYSLGNLYVVQGCLEDAERMYNRALAGYEKVFGPGHAYTLDTVNKLGSLYRCRGQLEDDNKDGVVL